MSRAFLSQALPFRWLAYAVLISRNTGERRSASHQSQAVWTESFVLIILPGTGRCQSPCVALWVAPRRRKKIVSVQVFVELRNSPAQALLVERGESCTARLSI
ncbi:hypothetical protein GGI43DRAFT_404413 [Trichoderma evansii]